MPLTAPARSPWLIDVARADRTGRISLVDAVARHGLAPGDRMTLTVHPGGLVAVADPAATDGSVIDARRQLALPLAFASTVLDPARRRVVVCTHTERPVVVVFGLDHAAVALGDVIGPLFTASTP